MCRCLLTYLITAPFNVCHITSFLICIALVIAARQVILPGEVMLGGLFPVHEAGRNGSPCGILKAAQGVQRLQAMLYAIEMINNNSQVLPGIKLGAQILDTCSLDSYALEQTLVFIKAMLSSGAGVMCTGGSRPLYQNQSVIAVIGAASSQVSVMVASMLQLFKVKRLGWTYVHAVAVTGSYGERGIDSFRSAAAERGICIDGDVHKISRRWSNEQFRKLFITMRGTRKARGVVMFVDEDHLRRLLENLRSLILDDASFEHYFWWVASDSWGIKASVISGYEDITSGAITVAPDLRTVPGFDEYFKSLAPTNTFLQEYWDDLNCNSEEHSNFGDCFLHYGLSFKQESYVSSVIDAVNVVAHAIHSYMKDSCGDVPISECGLHRSAFNGSRLQKYYRNVSLTPGKPPIIDANGDGTGKYVIYQLNSAGLYMRVGRWIAGLKLELDLDKVRSGLHNWNGPLPLSICSAECARGNYRVYQDQSCCWACIPCETETSIIINGTSCSQCPLGKMADANQTKCVIIPPTVLDYNSAWVIVPATFSTIGIATTFFVVVVFIRYNNTPVVMASGREVCYCMLFGISLCYLATFVLVSKPSVAVCAISRVLIGLAMSAIYGAILTKANRLARVFSPRSAARPDCILPKTQVAICACIVLVQVFGSLIWLFVDPPGTTVLFPTRNDAILTCKANAAHLLISLLYNMALIIACTLYAFKTRKIPENFNETRLIGFTMYSTSILWLSFGPIYFATQNNFKIQVTSLCICISMSGTVALCCFFAPKVYIVLWQPSKNVRTRHTTVGRLVNQQMRFIGQMAASTVNDHSITSKPFAGTQLQNTPPNTDPDATLTASIHTKQTDQCTATSHPGEPSGQDSMSELCERMEVPEDNPPSKTYQNATSHASSYSKLVNAKEMIPVTQRILQADMILQEITDFNDATFL